MKGAPRPHLLLALICLARYVSGNNVTNSSSTTTTTTAAAQSSTTTAAKNNTTTTTNNNNDNKNISQTWAGYTGPEYRKEIFPPQAKGVPLKVGISVMVRNLAKIDEDEGVVVMEVNLRVKWRDTRLRPPPDLAPDQYVPLDPSILKQVWVPDLYIDHSPSANTPSVLTHIASVWIYGDTTVDYSGNMFVEMSCRMAYGWFPRDHQICSFRMESYAYTLDRNVYVWVPPGLEVSSNIHSEQFLIHFEKTDPYTRVQDVYGTYPALAFRLHMTRRLSYMLLQVYLPSGLFVVVSFVSLLVPAEAIPGRMTLCITTILTMSALLGVAMQSTPSVSYVRAIDVWLLSCLSFVSIVLLEFGAVIKLREIENSNPPASEASKVVKISVKGPEDIETLATTGVQEGQTVPQGLNSQLLQAALTQGQREEEEEEEKQRRYALKAGWVLKSHPKMKLPTAKQVDRISLVLLPSCFVVFNLAYWAWFLTGSQMAIPDLKGSNDTVEAT
ncbi:glycine receptor subunit alpha-4-like [Eriocheir sinensis]|uniref:glycine receptor subunit alpha-4-like n=1 Tax=Eriocheir sinensis TaxID=95602 RepID=UPI0021C5CED9|nr:glycine receptor subunit alpha-4-like [Eriocheir sinensis]XP_050686231.1 glycine receptor subunit alpha-4-like [Eriocheir sinensis]XP_050686232.1 glycine receptor subunit alpha-4-like [Eriocheir sinensis]XP_050686234.1 glycine receptor subunit alpha-4-like [Eriocheir sinensis]XP_050686235.1 glycine receptor subunit alpha-4-like [Eriocheir sinensis]XP_050686236.1 glycine receptor subunit alpha-4-like [Eriocheir sinensis]XP_050686237.1 glycine receptor subunit alpha-4-like [Eriocheir sinensi